MKIKTVEKIIYESNPNMPFHFDSTAYNGDTLYYSYGKIDALNENLIGVDGGYGILGESGSSFILVQNNDTTLFINYLLRQKMMYFPRKSLKLGNN